MSTIPFFTTIPMRMRIPIRPITPRGVPVTKRPRSTPTNANGIENMITNGLMNDSNCEAITMYTRMMIITRSIIRSPNVSCWSSYEPAIFTASSEGISVSSMAFCAAAATSESGTPVPTTADTVTTRSRFFLLMEGGVRVSTTFPSSLILTPLPWLL